MTTEKRTTLQAETRTILGKKVKKLRREGKLPANVFGKKIPSLAVAVDRPAFEKAYRISGETQLIDLAVKGEKSPRPVLVSRIQADPVSDRIIHADFHQVDLTVSVVANVPLRAIGIAPAEKNEHAVIVNVLNELAVEALPTAIPEHLEINLAALEHIGDAIHVRDLVLPKGVVSQEDPEAVVATAQEQKKEEVEAAPAPAETEAGAAETPASSEETPAEKPAAAVAKASGEKQE